MFDLKFICNPRMKCLCCKKTFYRCNLKNVDILDSDMDGYEIIVKTEYVCPNCGSKDYFKV